MLLPSKLGLEHGLIGQFELLASQVAVRRHRLSVSRIQWAFICDGLIGVATEVVVRSTEIH